ncbi:MAG: hypothetical protein ABS882_05135, partial [Lysinibacillus sp.]
AGAVAVMAGTLAVVIPIVSNLVSLWPLLATVLGGVTGPIALVIAAAVAMGAGLIALWKTSDSFRNGISKSFESIKQVAVNVFGHVKTFVTQQISAIKSFWDSNGPQFLKAVQNVFNGIMAVVKFVMPAIEVLIKYVWNAIKSIITGALDVIMGAVKVFSGLFTGDFSKMWEGVKQLFSGAVKLILGIMSLTFVGGIRSAITNLAKTVINAIRNKWSSVVTLFKSGGTGAINAVKNMVSSVWNFVKNLATNFVNTISTMRTNVVNKFNDLKTSIINKVKEINLKQIGKDIVQGLISGIGNMFGNVKAKISELAGMIPEWAKDILDIHSPSRVMKAIGEFIGQGLAIGIDESSATVEKSSKSVATRIKNVFANSAKEQKQINQSLKSDISKQEKESSTTIQKMNADLQDKIKAIHLRAKEGKRKIKASEIAQIEKLENQHAEKVKKEREKLAATIDKLEKKAATDKAKVESEKYKKALDSVQTYVDNKKSLNQMGLAEEVEVWRKATTQFKVGSTERIKAQQNYQKALDALNKDMFDNIKNDIDKRKQLNQISLKDEVDIWAAAARTFKEGTQERLDAQKAYRDALDVLNKEIVSINETHQAEMQRINDELVKGEEEATKKYKDALESRYNSLMSFAGLFDEFNVEVKNSGTDLLKNLENQVNAMYDWGGEIDKLSQRGISTALLEELRGMGVKALPELIALNQLTDEQLSQYSALFAEKSEIARQQAESELIGMKDDMEKNIVELRLKADEQLTKLQNDWQSKIKGLTEATSSELSSLKQIGVNAGQGLLNGLGSMSGALIQKAREIAEAISGTIQSALDIHSPSRVMKGFGINIGQGLIIGMDSMIKKVAQSSASLSDAIASAQYSLNNSSARITTVPSTTSSSSSSVDNSRNQNNTINIYTTESPERALKREMRKMAFLL